MRITELGFNAQRPRRFVITLRSARRNQWERHGGFHDGGDGEVPELQANVDRKDADRTEVMRLVATGFTCPGRR